MSVHGYATPEVERTYARARELARAVGGQAEIFPAMAGLWQFYYVRGLLPTSRKLGHELLDIAHEAHDSTFLLLAHRSIASSAFLQGDFATCREHTEEGFRLYDMKAHGALALRMGHDPGVAHGVYLAWALWMLGYADQSLDRVMEMIELAKTLDHPMTTAYALCFAALVQNHRGEHPAARELSEAALEITVPNKFALWTAWGRMQRGWAMARTGDLEGGIPEMREGLLGWKNTGARVGFTMFPVTLAEICLHAGRLDDTQALLDEAAPMVGENDEHFYEPEMRRLMGELCLRRGGEGASDEAARHYQHGIEVARRLAGKSWERRLLMSRARLLADRGESARALEEMRTVEAWFTEGHGTADARAARAQIAALAGEGVVSAGHRV
jgi:adenylate cyclase